MNLPVVSLLALAVAVTLSCIAAAYNTDVRKLFRQMLACGLSMAVVAAVGCHIVFGVLWG